MNKYCIVNVDDFGTSAGVNRAVIEAHLAGIVTSTSLMVDQPLAAAAAALADQHPGLGVGLHAQLTEEDGRPQFDFSDVAASTHELERQLDRFHELVGRAPTHLDAHHNTHRNPRLTPVFLSAAEQLQIPLRDFSAVRWHGSFYAFWDGETHPEQVTFESLTAMLSTFGAGITELCTHVGYIDPDFDSEYHEQRELELATILDPRLPGVVADLGLTLINYTEVDHHGRHLSFGGAA
jgi:predicted glycoside hydrolase/deacetylase ChbG (UPF0249 family)